MIYLRFSVAGYIENLIPLQKLQQYIFNESVTVKKIKGMALKTHTLLTSSSLICLLLKYFKEKCLQVQSTGLVDQSIKTYSIKKNDSVEM